MMKNDISVEFRSDPKLLSTIRGTLRAYLERMDFAAGRQDEIILAVDEAVTNAIRHSYGGRTDETVVLRLRSCDEWIQIDISDQGACAERERVARKSNEEKQADDIKPGGLGVQLIYEICDDVKFEPGKPSGNHVRMRIRRPQLLADCGEQTSPRAKG